MNTLLLHRSIGILPPNAQQEVADYVAFLCYKYKTQAPSVEPESRRLPLKFGAGKGLIKYLSPDWENDIDQEFDLFNEQVS